MASYLYDRLHAHFPSGTKPFLETPEGQILTYADLDVGSARYANALRELGVGVGDRVAAQVEKSPEVIMLYLGCVRAGAIFLPLNTAYTAAEIDYFLRDAEPALLVCDPGHAAASAKVAAACGIRLETLGTHIDGTLVERAATAPTAFADASRRPEDLAAILYTSGTTGRSKGAMLTHANLYSNAETLVKIWHFNSDDVLIHALPIYHTHGLFVAINTLLAAGGSLLFLPRLDAKEILRLMLRATSLMGVPTFYTRLLQQEGLTPQATRHMRLFISGSAPLLAETHAEWRGRTGHAILERYGMTETNMNTSNPYDGERRAGTVGFPLPDISLRIADPLTLEEVPRGEIGMIEVKGPNVFKGYWRMPEKTAAEFRADGFFVTGDLGRIDQQGYVQIVGRDKDLVITGGFNVYPKEVESEIDSLPGIVESAVIGVPHADFGEGVTAIVVRDKAASIGEDMVLAALAPRLAKFKQPKRVIFVDDLPRNAMGKVQKNLLRATYKDIYSVPARVDPKN